VGEHAALVELLAHVAAVAEGAVGAAARLRLPGAGVLEAAAAVRAVAGHVGAAGPDLVALHGRAVHGAGETAGAGAGDGVVVERGSVGAVVAGLTGLMRDAGERGAVAAGAGRRRRVAPLARAAVARRRHAAAVGDRRVARVGGAGDGVAAGAGRALRRRA